VGDEVDSAECMSKPWNYIDNKDLHSFHSCQDLFCCTRTAHSNIPPWTMSNLIYCLLFVFTFPLLSSSFQVFVHRVEKKIIFISCQSLAVWSYVRQNSIKLSYTGMKLQNRPGTPKKKNHISSLPTYKLQKR